MKQIQLSTGHYIAIPLPEGARSFVVFNDSDKPYLSYFLNLGTTARAYLPPGQWTIIGTTKEIMQDEEKAIAIVETKPWGDGTIGYQHYTHRRMVRGIFIKPSTSFTSLCQLHQIGENDVWLKLQNNQTQPHRTGETAQ